MHLGSPVSGSDRHSVFRLTANDGSAARPRGNEVGEDDAFDGLVPTIEVAAEVERRRRSRNVQRRGKPERCIDRIAEEGETSEAKRRRTPSRGGKAAKSRSLAECAESQEEARRARRCETECTEPNEPLPGWRKPVSNRSGPGEASGASSRSSSGGRSVHRHRERLRKERRSGEIVRWKTFLADARRSPFTGWAEAAVSIGRATTLRVSKTRRGASSDR
jgi:hypothetical protein